MSIDPSASLRLWFFNTEVIIRVSETEGGDRNYLLDHPAALGDSPPMHRHNDQD
jgi:hypothetical protein